MPDIGKGWHIADIASGVTGAVVGGLDTAFGWSQKRQERAQKRLMDKQQEQWKEQQNILADQQLEQWNRENEYNDPTNYYKRLFAAGNELGITKAQLIGNSPVGSVGQSATGVSAPGSTSPPGVGGVQQQSIAAGMNTVLSGMRQRAEIGLLEAQIRNLDKQNEGIDSSVSLNSANEKLISAKAELVGQQFLTEQENTAIARCTQVLRSFEVNNWNIRNTAELAHIWASVRDLNSSSDKKREEIKFIAPQANAYISQMKSMVALNSAEALLKKTLAGLYGEQKAGQILENEMFRKTMDSKVKIINDEARWSGVYQLGQIMDNPYMTAGLVAARGDIVEVLTTELANAGLLETLPKQEREEFMKALKENLTTFAKGVGDHVAPYSRSGMYFVTP